MEKYLPQPQPRPRPKQRMKILQALSIFSAAIICIAAITASADTLTIAGSNNIFGAGHASPPGGGTLPPFVTFLSGQTSLTFSSITGTVTINVGSGSNVNNPDGIGAAPADSNTTSVGGDLGNRGTARRLSGWNIRNRERAIRSSPINSQFHDERHKLHFAFSGA